MSLIYIMFVCSAGVPVFKYQVRVYTLIKGLERSLGFDIRHSAPGETTRHISRRMLPFQRGGKSVCKWTGRTARKCLRWTKGTRQKNKSKAEYVFAYCSWLWFFTIQSTHTHTSAQVRNIITYNTYNADIFVNVWIFHLVFGLARNRCRNYVT